MFTFISIFSALIAVVICDKISKLAQGSGIPEIKSILSGVNFYQFLDKKTGFAKFLAIFFVKVAGLGIGFEAAFIHITACVGENLVFFKFFEDLRRNKGRDLAISASICVGIVIAFQAPIGGVVLGIELVSSNFEVGNLFKSFICSTISYFFSTLLTNVFNINYIKKHNLEIFYVQDIHLFILLGLTIGFIGSLFLNLYTKFIKFKQKHKKKKIFNKYIYIVLITILISLLSFPHHSSKFSFKTIISDLINLKNFKNGKIDWWYPENIKIDLLYNIITRFIILFLFTTANIPFGIFTPGLVLGCFLGRFFGESINYFFIIKSSSRIFAICGMSAFISCVTKTFSPLIIVLEMTKQFDLLLPMLVTLIFSFGVTGIFNIGFFEFIIVMKKLPFLPTVLSVEKSQVCLRKLQRELEFCLFENFTFLELFELFRDKRVFLEGETVVVLKRNRKILGEIKILNLLNFFEIFYQFLKDLKKDFNCHDNNKIIINLKNLLKKYKEKDIQEFLDFSEKEIKKILDSIEIDEKKFEMNSDFVENLEFEEDDLSVFQNDTYSLRKQNSLNFGENEKKLTFRFNSSFLIQKIDYSIFFGEIFEKLVLGGNSEYLLYEYPDLVIKENMSVVKVHYFFLTLNLDVIYIVDENDEVVGYIDKNRFLEFKTN